MNRQYQIGYKLAINGIPWMTAPPGYTLQDEGELLPQTKLSEGCTFSACDVRHQGL